MFCHHLQHLEILLKCVRSAHSNEIFLKVLNIYFLSDFLLALFVFKNISES